MSNLKTISLFDTLIYLAEIPKYLGDKDFMSVCNEHTDKAIKNTQQRLKKDKKNII